MDGYPFLPLTLLVQILNFRWSQRELERGYGMVRRHRPGRYKLVCTSKRNDAGTSLIWHIFLTYYFVSGLEESVYWRRRCSRETCVVKGIRVSIDISSRPPPLFVNAICVNNLPMTTAFSNFRKPNFCLFCCVLCNQESLCWKDKERLLQKRKGKMVGGGGVALVAGAGPGIGDFPPFIVLCHIKMIPYVCVCWQRLVFALFHSYICNFVESGNSTYSQTDISEDCLSAQVVCFADCVAVCQVVFCCLTFADCLTVCLLLSVWWRKRATSTWAVYVGLMASCKEALSRQMFHKDKAPASFPRTKMHTPDCRTKQGTGRCANPDCEDKRITWRKNSTIQGRIVCNNTTF